MNRPPIIPGPRPGAPEPKIMTTDYRDWKSRIPGVDRDWGRTLRLAGAAVAIVIACFLAACAGARVGTPAPQEHHQ